MKDQIAQWPRRYQMVPVAGQSGYVDMIPAKGVTQAGTPFNNASVLKDETAVKLGLDANAVPDDAFASLAESLTRVPANYAGGLFILTRDDYNVPIKNVVLSGLTGAVTTFTGDDGRLTYYSTTVQTLTISVPTLFGYSTPTNVGTKIEQGKMKSIEFIYNRAAVGTVYTYTSSQNLNFPPFIKTLDIFLLGGGGGGGHGGGSASSNYGPGGGGAGGGGGQGLNVYGFVNNSSKVYSLIVGVGGPQRTNGGNTTFDVYTALGGAGGTDGIGNYGGGGVGGNGGSGGGSGGGYSAGGYQGGSNGSNGADGNGKGLSAPANLKPFNSGAIIYGSGGSGAGGAGAGGAPSNNGGGAGGSGGASKSNGSPGQPGQAYGCGGGGGGGGGQAPNASNATIGSDGGAGAQGAAMFRIAEYI